MGWGRRMKLSAAGAVRADGVRFWGVLGGHWMRWEAAAGGALLVWHQSWWRHAWTAWQGWGSAVEFERHHNGWTQVGRQLENRDEWARLLGAYRQDRARMMLSRAARCPCAWPGSGIAALPRSAATPGRTAYL